MPSDDSPVRSTVGEFSRTKQERFDDAWGGIAPAVFTWASLHVRAPLRLRLDPDDVLQEVACRAWSRFDSWDPEQGVFRAWAFGIANNVLRESLRRMASEKRHGGAALLSTAGWDELPDTATRISRAVLRDEKLANLLAHLNDLPHEERRLLILRGLEGLPHDEVAEVLGLGREAVTKRWQRLCTRLRDQSAWAELVTD